VKHLKKLILVAAVVCTALSMPVTAEAATTWTVMPTQDLQSVTLNGVSCSSPSFCLALGINGPQPLVFEWNGTIWSQTADPDGATAMNAVSCVSATYCIAVGYNFLGFTGGTQAAAWLFDGTSWSELPAYNPATKWNYLKAIKCLSATRCEAVGLGGTHQGYGHHPLAEAWNGTRWTGQTVPSTVSGELDAVACTSPASCEAVGSRPASSGKTAGLALRWNGTRWVSQRLPVLAGGSRLTGVSCYSAGCTAVGAAPTTSGVSALAEAWNGSRWALQSPPGSGNVKGAVYTIWNAVHCQSASNCTVTGTWFPAAGGGNLTLAETWNGSTWAKDNTPTPGTGGGGFEAMSCTGGGRVCTAVGGAGGSGLAERN
jgi:hypothetical protein